MANPTEEDAPAEWQYTAKLAREGDTQAAREILHEIADVLEIAARDISIPTSLGDLILPWECAEYVAQSFRKILDRNEDAAKALGLKTARAGRPRGTKTHDEVRLAAAYWLMRRGGQTPERANELLRKATGADRRTIQNAAGGSCSAFEDRGLYDNRLLRAIALEQSSLAALIGRFGPPDESAE